MGGAAMLLEFAVENFKSYKERIVFSMEAGKGLHSLDKQNTMRISGTRLLKSAYIFGANASGKTNLLEAILLLKELVLRPTNDSISPMERMTFANEPNPTKFEITFFKNERVYKYFIEYDNAQVIAEELSVDDKCVFRRDGQEVSVISMREGLQTLRKNQLLLYWAQDKNVPEAVEAFSWFGRDIIDLSGRIDSERHFGDSEKEILENHQVKGKILSILRAADFNIVDYDFVTNAPIRARFKDFIENEFGGLSNIPDKVRVEILSKIFEINKLILVHRINGKNVKFFLNQESLGTKRFIQILVNILIEIPGNKIFLIDEFDRSFHPEMIKILVKLMNQWNKSNQFIATTHQFDVMDLNLRSDQIYFADKNFDGVSELYSVFDFADPALKKRGISYKKRYLNGLYGGTQIINEPELEAVFSDQEN